MAPRMVLDDKANVRHLHTTSDIRGGRINERTLPSTIIPSIEAAQASANGKNTITWSTNVAAGSGITAGDTWFQTASGLIVGQWEWSGSAWVVHTIDSLLIANLDAGKITTGTLAAGQKITAGDPAGSRVELDSAGLRKYAPDGTTVQVDLTGEVAAFSGLITGSEIVGGEFKTAASGARVAILQGDIGMVEFYSGAAAEYEPAIIAADADGNDGHVALISPGITGRRTAYLGLITKAESLVELYADSIETNTTTLEWVVANGYANLKRCIFVVADATERAALVARYVVAPLSRVIDATHPLFIWKADEAAGAQLQYTTDGTTFATIGGGSGTTLFADPNADRLVFWDDSAGAFAALTPSTGLTLTGTDLTVRSATDALMGGVELATSAETITGTDDTRATTPAGVKAAIDNGHIPAQVVQTTSNSAAVSTVETTLLTLPSITANGTTKVRVLFDFYYMALSVPTDGFILKFYDGATQIAQKALVSWQAVCAGSVSMAINTPAAGAHVYKATLVRSSGSGSGTCTLVASATTPATLTLEALL